ncbi:MAG: tRNA (adenosine(37)-N6)-threonylcarbamoyltransferase complex dimerization subunit type 1 TsaB [Bacilli bacterium]|nr:tRNA (adenosine(37)-N6)-threonylcarbamoyltransferase complex dimerization subunit type 1 TsaB [Bacilli bacterium]
MSSRILVIDTATKYIYLSLIVENKVKQTVYQEGINNHSVTIIPFLSEMLEKEHLTLKDITEVIIGIGPGSYTGVRIGVTVAKMIGYLNDIPVTTISSLALMATASDAERIIPMIDARRGNAFIASLIQRDGTLMYEREDSLTHVETFLKETQTPYAIIESGVPNAEKILGSALLQPIDDIHELIPNYLQATEAERNRFGNDH